MKDVEIEKVIAGFKIEEFIPSKVAAPTGDEDNDKTVEEGDEEQFQELIKELLKKMEV